MTQSEFEKEMSTHFCEQNDNQSPGDRSRVSSWNAIEAYINISQAKENVQYSCGVSIL
jgi:hypothetical protein